MGCSAHPEDVHSEAHADGSNHERAQEELEGCHPENARVRGVLVRWQQIELRLEPLERHLWRRFTALECASSGDAILESGQPLTNRGAGMLHGAHIVSPGGFRESSGPLRKQRDALGHPLLSPLLEALALCGIGLGDADQGRIELRRPGSPHQLAHAHARGGALVRGRLPFVLLLLWGRLSEGRRHQSEGQGEDNRCEDAKPPHWLRFRSSVQMRAVRTCRSSPGRPDRPG